MNPQAENKRIQGCHLQADAFPLWSAPRTTPKQTTLGGAALAIACLLVLACVACLWAAGPTATSSSKPAPERAASWDDYRLIVNRNIFSKDRRAPVSPQPPGPVWKPQPPKESFALTGIAMQEGEPIVFFESSFTRETIRVAVGYTLGGYTIKAISLDGVEVRGASGARTITIGQSLDGQTAALGSTMAPPVVAGPTTTSGPTTGPAASGPGGDTSGMSIEEKMKLRRLQENK